MERELIEWITQRSKEQSSAAHQRVVVGIGDDAAIVSAAGPTVWTTDTLVAGVHFEQNIPTLELVGRKALAVNLSDLAAMAATPTMALVTLVLPRSMTMSDAQSMMRGMFDLADQFGVAIVGGDTNRHDGPLIIGVALTGELATDSLAPAGWRMSGGQVGDAIVLTGPLGGSIAGRHLSFTPRNEFANWARQKYRINAATDVSDSLLIDLDLMCAASNCGAELHLGDVPVHHDAVVRSESSNRPAIEHAMHDGEDFELLLAMSPPEANRLVDDSETFATPTIIGTLLETPGLTAIDDDGPRPLTPHGYNH